MTIQYHYALTGDIITVDIEKNHPTSVISMQ